jgi:phage shock protein PspC (stress-responsive transcriptional regulator)
MTKLMSIAAGLAIGYFIWQYVAGNRKGTTNGRIHKSSRDKKLAGVCGGIAEWLGVDPMIIRLAWAALILGWGSGLLAYIVCALVLPEETGAAEEE